MADLPDRDLSLLLDMLLASRDALEFTRGLNKEEFLSSRLHQAAVIRTLEVIGEAAGHVSFTSTEALPEIPWREITGMRHRLIHGYADVDLELVWQVVMEDVPPLVAALELLVPPEEDVAE